MFGGYGGNGRLDDFYEFDFETQSWSEVKYNGKPPGDGSPPQIPARVRLNMFGLSYFQF
jgi:hypothetical protein